MLLGQGLGLSVQFLCIDNYLQESIAIHRAEFDVAITFEERVMDQLTAGAPQCSALDLALIISHD